MKTDLLFKEVIEDYNQKIEKVKAWMIYASAGETEKYDPAVLKHLRDLSYLQSHLNDLKENLKDEWITVVPENLQRASKSNDYIIPEKIKETITQIEAVKSWIIFAATGETEKNDPYVLDHLKELNMLQIYLSEFKELLKKELIIFDNVKVFNTYN